MIEEFEIYRSLDERRKHSKVKIIVRRNKRKYQKQEDGKQKLFCRRCSSPDTVIHSEFAATGLKAEQSGFFT